MFFSKENSHGEWWRDAKRGDYRGQRSVDQVDNPKETLELIESFASPVEIRLETKDSTKFSLEFYFQLQR